MVSTASCAPSWVMKGPTRTRIMFPLVSDLNSFSCTSRLAARNRSATLRAFSGTENKPTFTKYPLSLVAAPFTGSREAVPAALAALAAVVAGFASGLGAGLGRGLGAGGVGATRFSWLAAGLDAASLALGFGTAGAAAEATGLGNAATGIDAATAVAGASGEDAGVDTGVDAGVAIWDAT